jgi:VanZ family protein
MVSFLASRNRFTLSFACFAMSAIVAVVVGTLLPFRFDASPSASLLGLSWQPSPAIDLATNLLVYVPVALFASLSIRHRIRSNVTRSVVVVAVATALSFALESAQLHMSYRVGSWIDVIANAFGATAGAVLATFVYAIRPIRFSLFARMHATPYSTAAKVYLAGLFVYHLLPLDVVTSSAAFWESLRHTRLFPAIRDITATDVVGWTALAGQFGLLTVLTSLGRREKNDSVRTSLIGGFATAVVLAGLIETTQIFVVSHSFNIMQIAACMIGGVIGLTCSAIVIRSRTAIPPQRFAIPVLTGIATYLFVEAVSPFDFLASAAKPSLGALLPFWYEFKRPFPIAATDIAQSAVTFALLALLIRTSIRRTSPFRRAMCVVVATTTVAVLCEACQLFTPTRIACVTEPTIAFGASIVVCTLARVVSAPSTPPPSPHGIGNLPANRPSG